LGLELSERYDKSELPEDKGEELLKSVMISSS